MTCEHHHFCGEFIVNRIEDIGRIVAEVRIHCTDCKQPFQFIGCSPGFNYDGPTVSLDGLELNVPICPQGATPTPLQGLLGFSVKGHN